MLLRQGIVRKTFLFVAMLITLVTFISFAILYFAMPEFYRTQKERDFQRNLDTLATSLGSVTSQDEYTRLISAFSEANNAVVISLDADRNILPTMSLPFLLTQGLGGGRFLAAGEMPETTVNILVDGVQSGQSFFVGSSEQPTLIMRTQVARPVFQYSGYTFSSQAFVGTDLAGYIVANTTLQPISEARGVLLSLLPYVFLSVIAIGLIFAWIYARQISKPVLQISGAAEKMQQMQPGVISGVRSHDELGLLSQNLDDMYASLIKNISDLKFEKDRATTLERSKTEMLQSASHELKTPIAALNGMLEGMADNVGVYKDREKYLVECIGETRKLSSLVEEILTASKTDAIEDALEISEVSLDELVASLLDEYSVPIREKGLSVRCVMPPITLATDETVLGRALSNLISNAVHYTTSGGEIRLSFSGERLIVENQCAPIPEDELERFFEPFYTRSQSRDKTQSGTGLGLYIVKRSLERLGMSCHAETSEPGIRIVINLHAHYIQATH